MGRQILYLAMSTDPGCPLLVVLMLQDLTSESPDGLTITEKLFVWCQAPSPASIEDLREQSFCEQVITNPGLVKPQCASTERK